MILTLFLSCQPDLAGKCKKLTNQTKSNQCNFLFCYTSVLHPGILTNETNMSKSLAVCLLGFKLKSLTGQRGVIKKIIKKRVVKLDPAQRNLR